MLEFLLLFCFQDMEKTREGTFNLKKKVAIHGFDPVAYFQGAPAKGKDSLQAQHKGVIYYFSKPQNRTLFLENPARYEPQYGGWCAYAMLEGEKVDIDPVRYKIVNDKLYLFYHGLFGDTRKKWDELVGDKEAEHIEKANLAWAKILDAHY